MSSFANQLFDPSEVVASLSQAFGTHQPDPSKVIRVGLQVADSKASVLRPPDGFDRTWLLVVSGETTAQWRAESLRGLFRGDRVPPQLDDYSKAYADCFGLLDVHLSEFSRLVGPPRDEELRELFSLLRRRPDGKSTGFLHDYVWQALALILGTHALSEAEYNAILARHELSCRRAAMGPSSRNFVARFLDR